MKSRPRRRCSGGLVIMGSTLMSWSRSRWGGDGGYGCESEEGGGWCLKEEEGYRGLGLKAWRRMQLSVAWGSVVGR